jgi:peptidoglycan/LPS O-acetylase OafA/YrhL
MALPSAFWAVTFSIAYRRGASQSVDRNGTTITSLVAAIIATAWTWHAGRNMIAENLAGLAFLIFALGGWDNAWVRRLAALGPLAYGIYLSHLLFVKTCESVTTKLHWPDSVAVDLATFAVAASGSTLLAWLLTRSKWTRWAVA